MKSYGSEAAFLDEGWKLASFEVQVSVSGSQTMNSNFVVQKSKLPQADFTMIRKIFVLLIPVISFACKKDPIEGNFPEWETCDPKINVIGNKNYLSDIFYRYEDRDTIIFKNNQNEELRFDFRGSSQRSITWVIKRPCPSPPNVATDTVEYWYTTAYNQIFFRSSSDQNYYLIFQKRLNRVGTIPEGADIVFDSLKFCEYISVSFVEQFINESQCHLNIVTSCDEGVSEEDIESRIKEPLLEFYKSNVNGVEYDSLYLRKDCNDKGVEIIYSQSKGILYLRSTDNEEWFLDKVI